MQFLKFQLEHEVEFVPVIVGFFAKPVDLVLVARASIVGKHYSGVERDYLEALKKARLYREEAGAPSPKTP